MRYNIVRPLTLLAVAFLSYQITYFLLTAFGQTPKDADNVAFVVMMISALITFKYINPKRRKR